MAYRRILLVAAALIISAFQGPGTHAQTSRKSVSRAEATGTFRHSFTGKFKGSSSEIKILALSKGKVKIAFDLIYPYVNKAGEIEANIGQARGEAEIKGDTAVFSRNDHGPCTITIKFVRPGSIRTTQDGDAAACGFGQNVTADGTYKKTSGAKPKLEDHP